MTSATEELRRMLDERGVEWYEPTTRPNTTWFPDSFGINCRVKPWGEVLQVKRYGLTPEKAIAATLGQDERTCQLKRASWDDGTCTWGCICSACDAHLEHETGIGYNFCPNCGAKVVDE